MNASWTSFQFAFTTLVTWARDDQILAITEFFHPRIEEFCGTLPAGLGHYIEARPKLAAWLDRRINRGRRIRTDSLIGFGMLWVIGGLRHWRRKLCSHGSISLIVGIRTPRPW